MGGFDFCGALFSPGEDFFSLAAVDLPRVFILPALPGDPASADNSFRISFFFFATINSSKITLYCGESDFKRFSASTRRAADRFAGTVLGEKSNFQ